MSPRNPNTKPTDVIGFHVKMREALRARLEREARANDDTLGAEITRRLERSFEVDAMKGLVETVTDLTKAVGKARRRLEPV